MPLKCNRMKVTESTISSLDLLCWLLALFAGMLYARCETGWLEFYRNTALNNIMDAVDKIKQSAVAYGRCFLVEVMGGACGYLALMSGLATGAERVYLPEEGVTLQDLQTDLADLISSFQLPDR